MKARRQGSLLLCAAFICCLALCGCGAGSVDAAPSAAAETPVEDGAEATADPDATAGAESAGQPPWESSMNPSEQDTATIPLGNKNATSGNPCDDISAGSGQVPEDAAPRASENDPPTPSPGITIIMVGDILLHDPVEEAAREEDGSYDFSFIFDNLRDEIEGADIAIVNQEVIIGGEELRVSGYPSFNAPFEIADALAETGFDVICHATNHALDRGGAGIKNSLAYWREHYPEMTVTGISDGKEDPDALQILEAGGMKIAILNYTYGTNGISMPGDMPNAVNLLKEDKVIKDLQAAEEQADFTIVCPHWGTEYNTGTDSSQRRWSEIFRANGADLVIGTHPHVIEPTELFEDEDPALSNNRGDGDMLVFYSLGNFVNWTSGQGAGVANRMVGGMAEIEIVQDPEGAHISDYGIKALVCHVEKGHHGVKVYPLSEYTDELAAENAIIKQDSHFSKEYCLDLCDEIWGDLWE